MTAIPDGTFTTEAPTATPVLRVDSLSIDRTGSHGPDPVVSSFSLDLAPGETVGIVGESGSGKSVTARAIMGLLPASLSARGEVLYADRNLLDMSERDWRRVRGGEIGLILQDPFMMLNPVFRCGRIIEESLVWDGGRPSRAARRAEVVRRLAEVGLTDPSVADRYPFQLSGGMRQRVGVAAALARDPKVLIADEPTTALDVTTQKEMLTLLRGVQTARGMSLVLITHDLRVAFAMCDRIYVLYGGSLVEVAPASELERSPQHPYTQGLLLSEPSVEYRVAELPSIPGSVPKAKDVTSCCSFAPRCQWAQPACVDGAPPLLPIGPTRLSACIRLPEIAADMALERTQASMPAPLQGTPVPSGRPLIEVRDLCKVFTSNQRSVAALDRVSLEVGDGESVAIVGESGSGKTTLARTLVGLERPTSGDIVIDGVPASDWSTLSARDRRKLRSTVQMVFQDPYASLNPMRSVGSALSEAIRSNDPEAKDLPARVAALFETVGLHADYAARKPAALSGGERQRVAIARALAVNPRFLICDEPVSALDVSVRAQIINLFASLRQERGVGFVFITHDLSMLRQVTERVCIMYRGRVVESGPVDQILDAPSDPYTIRLLESIPRSESAWFDEPAQS